MPKAKQIYQSLTNERSFIRLERKQDYSAMWDYCVYTGNVENLFDSRLWSRSQMDDRKPGVSEWTLQSHYKIYDEFGSNGDGVFYSKDNDTVYSGTHRKSNEDTVVPLDIINKLFILESFETPEQPLTLDIFDSGNDTLDALDDDLTDMFEEDLTEISREIAGLNWTDE